MDNFTIGTIQENMKLLQYSLEVINDSINNSSSSGTAGTKGDTGAQGIQGIPGQTGAAGAAGTDGNDGAPGAAGTNGNDGAPGADATLGNISLNSLSDVDTTGAQDGNFLMLQQAFNASEQPVGYEWQRSKSNFTGIHIGKTALGHESYNAVIIRPSESEAGELGPDTFLAPKFSNNIAIGKSAGAFKENIDTGGGLYTMGDPQGDHSTAIGTEAGASSQGENSIAIGYQAGWKVQGLRCITIGNNSAMYRQANDCIAIGYRAGGGTSVPQEHSSVAIGAFAGGGTMKSESVAIGYYAGYNVGIQSVCIGAYTQLEAVSVQNAARCVTIGYLAKSGGPSEQYQIAIGYNACACVKNGCIALGAEAASNGGDNNIAIGRNAQASGVNGGSIAIGEGAKSSGNHADVAIGKGAFTQADDGIAIGRAAHVNPGHNFSIVFGANTVSTGSNEVRFRPNMSLFAGTIYNHTSDDRLKHNETPITNGIDVIKKVIPLVYKKAKKMYNEINNEPERDPDGNIIYLTENDIGNKGEDWHYEAGYIAQEIHSIPELSEYATPGDEKNPWYLSSQNINTYTLACAKELITKVETLETENILLKTKLNEVLSKMNMEQI